MKRTCLAFAALALAALALAAPAGAAGLGLKAFDVAFEGPEGEAQLKAGSHPFAMTTTIEVQTEETPEGPFPVEAVKDLEIEQVTGFAGNPTAVPQCSTLDFFTHREGHPEVPECSDASAVGTVNLTVGNGEGITNLIAPVYNLVPPPGTVAKLGFLVNPSVPVTMDITVSEKAPYRVSAHVTDISQALEFYAAELTLWGVPADPRHNAERGLCGGETGPPSCPAGVAESPFLTLPRACTGPLATSWEMDSWAHPGTWVKGQALTHDESGTRGMGGCGQLEFAPQLQIAPSSTSAESASGLGVGVTVKDEGLTNAGGTANSDIRAIETALPRGVTLNPSAAEGLGVCTLAQYEAESLLIHGCPQASKLGTIEVETPVLENHPLHGALYLASQYENPFGSLAALYLVIRDPALGIFVKQAGEVRTDEAGGQVLASFEEIPQFPLSRISLQMRSGPRAPLITPPACGTYAAAATITPWSGGAALPAAPAFAITSGPGGGPCPPAIPAFHPGFEAGTLNNAAGAYSPFEMRLTRQDADQDITRFSATLPPGVVGKIAGVPRCSDAQIAAAKLNTGRAELASPSCPAASRIGHVLAGAGVGSALTYVPGTLYLAGPYNGAPLSVVAIVPAVAGPFDVGTVITREALALNPLTAEVEVDGAASDPIPHMLKGIPLALRDLRVYVDRPEFTLNATNCAASAARAGVTGSGADPFSPADDAPFALSARYQAADCAALRFSPKLALALKGATKRTGHPALHSLLTYPQGPGYANVKKAVVTLPSSELIDNAHINNPCTRVQFNADACPPSSILGTARAYTPLLDEPLEGPVYFRSNGGERALPDVVADLHGLFQVVLVGFVDTATPKTDARIRTTFATVPDAPVSKFELNLYGGKRGLLVNSADLCAEPRRATLELTGQNGRRANSKPVIGTSCKKPKRHR